MVIRFDFRVQLLRAARSLLSVALGVCLAFSQQARGPVPEMVRIPAGPFLMGSDHGASWEQPVHKVEVSEFWIAKRPVTFEQFRAFRPNHGIPPGVDPAHPVTGVSWYDANAYCKWLRERTGKPFRLPTDAEWEKAARGGLEQKKYPWGDEPPVPQDKLGDKNFEPQIRANGYGAFFGTHNLWEWTADRYAADYYENSPVKDPRGPSTGEYRVLRGGGYRTDPNSMRCANRGSSRPSASSDVVTFRVAYDGKRAPAPAVTERQETPTPAPLLEVNDVTFAREAEVLVVRVSVSGEPRFETLRLTAPDRLVIDLPGAIMKAPSQARSIEVNELGVERIRSAQFQTDPPVARVVVDMQTLLDYEINVHKDGLEVRFRPRS